jgi:uncharacterized RDD family membrane protein YckC
MTDETVAATPEGFKPADAKRRFTVGAIIVGVIGFLAPMVLPFLMIPAMMIIPLAGLEPPRSSDEIPLRSSAFWNERVWFVDKSETAPASPAGASIYILKSVADGEGSSQAREETTLVSLDEPQLLAVGDRLWLLSESSLGYFVDGRLTVLPCSDRRGDLSVPFLYDGKPAAMELLPNRTNLLVVEGDTWVLKNSGRLSSSEGQISMKQIRGVQAAEHLSLYMKCGSTIFAAEWLPDSEKEPDWVAVTKTDSYIDAVAIDDSPVVFYYRNGRLAGLQQQAGVWNSFCDLNVDHERNMRVFPGPASGTARVVRDVNGRIRLAEIVNGQFVDKTIATTRQTDNNQTNNNRFIPAFMAGIFATVWGLFMLVPCAMIVALTVLMKKYRTSEYQFGGRHVVFASLLQRGVASLIDTALFALPAIAGMIYVGWKTLNEHMANAENQDIFIGIFFGVIAGGFLMSLIGQVILSIMEGRWGITPGKWLCRIQVLNLELKPCGFWRAVGRRLILFADAFFNYLIGTMMIAFMPKWQRLGDLAVGTIVIRKR